MKIYQGNCLEVLKTLDDNTIQCCVTSPPYWGLRSYDGGSDELGIEKTPEEYVEKLVEIFREIKRVLRNDGTVWLNLGDSYYGGGWKGSKTDLSGTKQGTNTGTLAGKDMQRDLPHPILKKKDLVGIPWRVALALQADGWWLRQDIIFSKGNPMPESTTDRCTKSHEYIFLLTKSAHYYYDHEAIKEPQAASSIKRAFSKNNIDKRKDADSDIYAISGKAQDKTYEKMRKSIEAGEEQLRNRRSVWNITTKPYKGAHFATFSPEIPEICIKAGSKEGDIVLDPFSGAGTTGVVAIKLGREYIGIELNPDYIKMSEKRIQTECGSQMFLKTMMKGKE